MRSEYGKLMYLLMDSAEPNIQELIEFRCVRPLKTVYSTLGAQTASTAEIGTCMSGPNPSLKVQCCGADCPPVLMTPRDRMTAVVLSWTAFRW